MAVLSYSSVVVSGNKFILFWNMTLGFYTRRFLNVSICSALEVLGL
jgi:hypothetical protein